MWIDKLNPFSEDLSYEIEKNKKSIDFITKKIVNSEEPELLELNLLLSNISLSSLSKQQLTDLNNQLLLLWKELSKSIPDLNEITNISEGIKNINELWNDKKDTISSASSEKSDLNTSTILESVKNNFWEDSDQYMEISLFLDNNYSILNSGTDKTTLELLKLLKTTNKPNIFSNTLASLIWKTENADKKGSEGKEDDNQNIDKDLLKKKWFDISTDDVSDLIPSWMSTTEFLIWVYILINWWASLTRNLKDIINVNLWDQIWKWEARDPAEIQRELSGTDDPKKIKSLKKELFKASLKKYASWQYLNEVTRSVNILELSTNTSTEQNEYLKRKEHLTKAKDYYFDDPEMLKKLDDLESSWLRGRLQSWSKSFWIQFHSIIEQKWIIGKWFDIFIKPVRFEHAKEVIGITDKYVQKWWDGIKFVYEATWDSRAWKINIEKEWTEHKKTNFLRGVYSIIDSNPDLSSWDKSNIKWNIETYLNKITSNRIADKKRILEELNRMVNWYDAKLNMLDTVEEAINELNRVELANESLSWFEKIWKDLKSATWIDYALNQKENYLKKRKLNQVKEMIYKWELVLTKSDLNKIIKNINDNKDIFDNVNRTRPNLWNPSDLETKATKISWQLKDAKEFITKDWFIENIKSYVTLDWTVTNTDEKEIIKRLEEYQKNLEDWKIDVDKEQVRLDIIKISKWYLPFYKAIDIVNDKIKKSTSDSEKQWLELLKKKILDWRWTTWSIWEWTEVELFQAINDFKNWINQVDKKVVITDVEIDRILDRWKKINWSSIKDSSGNIDNLFKRESFDTDMKLRQIREMMIWWNYSFKSDLLDELFNKLKTNNYTKWHFLYLATQIIEWNTVSGTFVDTVSQEATELEYNKRNVKNDKVWSDINIHIETEITSIKWEADLTIKMEKTNKLKEIVNLIESSWLGDFLNKDKYRKLKANYDSLLSEIESLKKEEQNKKNEEKEKQKENEKQSREDEKDRKKEEFKELKLKYNDIINDTTKTKEQKELDILEISIKSRLKLHELPLEIQWISSISSYYQRLNSIVDSNNKTSRKEIFDTLNSKYWVTDVESRKIREMIIKEALLRRKARNSAKPK